MLLTGFPRSSVYPPRTPAPPLGDSRGKHRHTSPTQTARLSPKDAELPLNARPPKGGPAVIPPTRPGDSRGNPSQPNPTNPLKP